jgi:thiamine biosynthesis lipoprotein
LKISREISFKKNRDSYGITFYAMASPCEIIVQSCDEKLAKELGNIISTEVWRIEDKYSRYNNQSLCSAINNSAGQSVKIDQETYLLLMFAEHCYQLSDGLFDISSGIFRKLWSFHGSNHKASIFPSQKTINTVLSNVGWKKIHFDNHQITLPKKMEIDFGGIGKEYAVDRSIILAKEISDVPILVNLGGDLAVTGPRLNNDTWQVAIERPDIDTDVYKDKSPDMIISLKSGALATSGDAKRFIIQNNKRYGHILNAKTGWPVVDAPRSITVVAPQCSQAGILSTLALLQGAHAEQFLTEQSVKFWARR